MALKVSQRGLVPAFMVMEVMQAAADRTASGRDVLHLEVGQPGTAAPQGVREASKRAIDIEKLGYTVALGIDPLREAIASHYRQSYGVTVRPENVVATTGSSGGFLLSLLACFDPGDRVALAEPGYPCCRNILMALGLEPVALPVDHNSRFQPTVAMLEALDEPIDGLIVASPSNPTGTMVSRDDLAALSAHCSANGIRLISDEIYHGVSYGMEATTVASINPDAVVINSFSKYFSMTGWRIGWMVVPDNLLKPIERLAQNFFISPPTLSQHAAVAAFDCHDELQANIAVYTANRELLLDALPKAGLTKLSQADGAFYIYADISDLSDDSQAFCKAILDHTGVAITPGLDFDPVRGHRSVRISFSGPTEDMAEAARRLGDWIKVR
ncbi:MAG: 1-aminocyclopropane-1-carboxylate deaminase [Rhodospirillaceae bacterium]|nr:1-aminocyclopropane-1-carboxylate deaminase [Rhodospirillaceae bacterium]|tara:strand:+ start:1675 stop:2829 length:1155 start_codon:yes stop_codon:yes gene_type:complete